MCPSFHNYESFIYWFHWNQNPESVLSGFPRFSALNTVSLAFRYKQNRLASRSSFILFFLLLSLFFRPALPDELISLTLPSVIKWFTTLKNVNVFFFMFVWPESKVNGLVRTYYWLLSQRPPMVSFSWLWLDKDGKHGAISTYHQEWDREIKGIEENLVFVLSETQIPT